MADVIDNNTQVATNSSSNLPIVQPSKNDGSMIGSLSVRGLLALLLILTISILAISKRPIPDVVSNLSIAICAFYYGHTIGRDTK